MRPARTPRGRGGRPLGPAQACSDTKGHSRARARLARLGAQLCGFHPHASGECARRVTMSQATGRVEGARGREQCQERAFLTRPRPHTDGGGTCSRKHRGAGQVRPRLPATAKFMCQHYSGRFREGAFEMTLTESVDSSEAERAPCRGGPRVVT